MLITAQNRQHAPCTPLFFYLCFTLLFICSGSVQAHICLRPWILAQAYPLSCLVSVNLPAPGHIISFCAAKSDLLHAPGSTQCNRWPCSHLAATASFFSSGEDRGHEIAAPVRRNHGWPGWHGVWRTSVKQQVTSRTPWATQLHRPLWPSNDDDGTTHPAHPGTLKYPNNTLQVVPIDLNAQRVRPSHHGTATALRTPQQTSDGHAQPTTEKNKSKKDRALRSSR